MKIKLILSAFLLCTLLAGCVKTLKPSEGETSAMDLDWKTTQTVNLNINSEKDEIAPFFVYDKEQLVFSGFTPFNANIVVPSSATQLTISMNPIENGRSRAWTWKDGVVEVDCGNGIVITMPSLIDHHDYLKSEWGARSAIGVTWTNYVAWWNTPGSMAQSSIKLYVDKEPILNPSGEITKMPHTCLWPQCNENESSDDVEQTEFTTAGTYMFEDLFPSMGDYDMNDIVIEEEVTSQVSIANKVMSAELNYKVNAVGASNVIAMAVNLPFTSASAIEKVELFRVDNQGNKTSYQCRNVSGIFMIEDNGLEVSNTNTVIPFFDDIKAMIPNLGHHFNTVVGGGSGDPLQFKAEVTFKAGLEPASPDFKTDVFIMTRSAKTPVSEHRGNEIHVTYANYTSYMNTSLFQTYDDYSNVIQDKQFRTKKGYVWGIYVPITDFKHTIETVSISDAYPKFDVWVQSGGHGQKDWYKKHQEGSVWIW